MDPSASPIEPSSVAASSSSSSAIPPIPSAALAVGTAAASSVAGLSKKAVKRAAREAHWEATKGERRAKEKAKKKERNAARQAEGGEVAEQLRAQNRIKDSLKTRFREGAPGRTCELSGGGEFFDARIVIDLAFDDLMIDKEIKSMAGQVAYTYNAHRSAAKPFRSLLFTHLDKRLKEQVQHSYWQTAKSRFKATEWWDDHDFDQLWADEATPADNQPASSSSPSSSSSITAPLSSSAPPLDPITRLSYLPSRSAKDRVVYLSADSPNEIDALEEGYTYVIGGIVDRNRYKNLCFEKAEKLGIQTARLPIGTYLSEMQTRKVLTVNQVYEILTGWVELRDWKSVLQRVIPDRKFEGDGRKTKRARQSKRSVARDGSQSDESSEGEEKEAAKGSSSKPELVDDEEAVMNEL